MANYCRCRRLLAAFLVGAGAMLPMTSYAAPSSAPTHLIIVRADGGTGYSSGSGIAPLGDNAGTGG